MAKRIKPENFEQSLQMLLDLMKGIKAVQSGLTKDVRTLHFNQNSLIKDVHNLNYRCQVTEVRLEELEIKKLKKKVMN